MALEPPQTGGRGQEKELTLQTFLAPPKIPKPRIYTVRAKDSPTGDRKAGEPPPATISAGGGGATPVTSCTASVRSPVTAAEAAAAILDFFPSPDDPAPESVLGLAPASGLLAPAEWAPRDDFVSDPVD